MVTRARDAELRASVVAIMESPVKVLLATPTYDGTISTMFYRSIVQLLTQFCSARPDVALEIPTSSLSSETIARNRFATTVLFDRAYSHLLFIDGDVGFAPRLIARMLDWDKPIVTAFYPSTDLGDGELHGQARRFEDAAAARAAAQKFVAEDSLFERQRPPYRVQGGFMKVNEAGTGIMLMQRVVLETIRDRFPELVLSGSVIGASEDVFRCFAPLRDDAGYYLEGDAAFCHRWVHGCGGEIWACVAEPLSHVGRKVFHGSFTDRLAVKSAVSPDSGLGVKGEDM